MDHPNKISRIYKGSELVYQAPDTQPLTAYVSGLVAGDRIELFRAANIRTDAVISTATFKGVNPHGTRGTIVGGPKTGVSNSIWYDINFDVGFDGWCVSDNYTKISSTTTQTTPSYFKVGDRIRLFRASNVRSSAAIATNLKGVNPSGALGTITQGPTKNGTINWYNINFDTGHDGWVASDNYVVTTTVGPGTPWVTGSCAPAVPSNGKIINVAAGGNIDAAINSANPGDTVVLASGTYNGGVSLNAANSGTANGWITIKSATPHGAKVTKKLLLVKCDYIRIEGIEFNGKVGAEAGIGATACHHLQIINNRINIGSIKLGLSDFLLVEGNVVHGHQEGFNQTAILWPQNITGDMSTRNRIIYRNNVSYECGSLHSTDGNGLILDNFDLVPMSTLDMNNYIIPGSRVTPKAYPFGVIVDNNIFYNNNGRGITLNATSNATITNNICYNNERKGNRAPWTGEIGNISASNNLIKDNVFITAGNGYAIACQNFSDKPPGKNNTWTGNYTYDKSRPGDAAISTNASCPIPASTNHLGQGAQYNKQPTDFLKEPCA